MIRGVLRRDGARRRPFVSALLTIPSLHRSADTAFLVDTGADGTLLAPRDAALMGVDVGLLPSGPTSTGVGGTVRTVQVAATLALGPDTYDLMLRILAPDTRSQRSALARIPSLLGRDILARFALFYDDHEELVLLLEPDEAADLRRHLP
jgi:predicted aspartyl protease